MTVVAFWNARRDRSQQASAERRLAAAPAGAPAAEPGTAEADAAALAAVAGGDLDALGGLYDRYAPALERTLARWRIAAADIDDLVQATFLEIVHAAPRFERGQSVRAWLFGVAHIMARRHRRSLARAFARLARSAAAASGSAAPPPSEAYEGEEATRRLERAFARLSPKKRDVFVLVTIEGWSGEEAARALGIPLKTVWTRLHHARLELRAAIEEHGA